MDQLVADLLIVFRYVAAAGFVATGGLMVAFTWKLYKKLIIEKLKKDFNKYRWGFFLIVLVITTAWIYMYYLLFIPEKPIINNYEV